MPLVTNDIGQARESYDALESRALSAEARVQVLQSALDEAQARRPISIEQATALHQHVVDTEAENVKLQIQVQQLPQIRPDLPLDNLIAGIGLAAAIGEATMPDRAIASIGANVRSYIAPTGTGIGLRFQQPDFGPISGISSITFEMGKVPPPPGGQAPRNLYAVLADKQRVYTDPFWTRFPPAPQAIAEIAKVFANTGGWNFPFLAQEAAAIAGFEKSLAPLVAAASPGAKAAAYSSAVDSLSTLTSALVAKPIPVAGDLFELARALDASTAAANAFLQ